jgi:hypothetical protein
LALMEVAIFHAPAAIPLRKNLGAH